MEFQESKRVVTGRFSPERAKLGSILNFEKDQRSYDDLHTPKPKGLYQKQQSERKSRKSEEVVRYMSNLPCYLERGEKSKEKAFNLGVLDFRLLENWEHNNHRKIPPVSSEAHGVTFRAQYQEPLETHEEMQVGTSYVGSRLDRSFHSEITNVDESTSGMSRRMSHQTDFPASPSVLQKLPEDEFYQSKMETSKGKNSSPNRRFSFTLGKKSSSTEKSKVISNSGEKSNASNSKAGTSPLRRLLDPLFKSSEKNPSPRDKTPKPSISHPEKVKLEIKGPQKRSSIMQALLQIAVKNGLPVFTFTVDNSNEILVATFKPRKRSTNTWVYTFFSFSEMKKKNSNWINQGCKDGYAPNIVAKLNVSEMNRGVREFVLSSMSSSDELAAIVVKFPEKGKRSGDSSFSVAVVLPGGDHGVPRKGDPSPLIERWKSGGLCDCGGWDLGCRLRVLDTGNPSSKTNTPLTTFKLFKQEEEEESKPSFTVSPFEEGIFSVEFNASIQVLQAFSTGIAILSSGMMPVSSADMFSGEISEEITLSKTETNKTSNKSTVDSPGEYVSYPPHSPFGRV